MNFRHADIEAFGRIGVSVHTLELAQVKRVTHDEAKALGISARYGRLDGIAFPYLHPQTGNAVRYRLRRDHPEMKTDGKPKNKYLASMDPSRLYFAPSCHPQLADSSATAIIVEAEKSVLAIIDAEVRANRPRVLPIATGGCDGWQGRVGKTVNERGARVDETGPVVFHRSADIIRGRMV
jgi:hypothetical protein